MSTVRLDVQPIGLGTERLEEAVAAAFPGRRVCRVDRDSVRRAGELERIFGAVADGSIDIRASIGVGCALTELDAVGTAIGSVGADLQVSIDAVAGVGGMLGA